MDNYYQRHEVSNSDLSWLKNQLHPRDMPDPESAYKFGSLIDAMITENHRVDYFKRSLDDITFTNEDFELAERMKRVFYADSLCVDIASMATGQSVTSRPMEIVYEGVDFSLDVRCKWDFWCGDYGWGADLKSTTATTQAQFEAACEYFDYDRQRAWYMDIGGSDRDVLIGISKKNLKVFKVNIKRGGGFYNRGKAKYQDLAFRWWTIYGNNRPSDEKDN